MTEAEFIALLKISGKTLVLSGAAGEGWWADVTGPETREEYIWTEYDTRIFATTRRPYPTKEEAIKEVMKRYEQYVRDEAKYSKENK